MHMRPNFMELIMARWAKNLFVSVGLDSDLKRLPKCLTGTAAERQLDFNRAIIEAVNEHTLAFKPNLAFYLSQGAEGIAVLEKTCALIREIAPDVPVILDCKFGDIGNTNLGYVEFAFQRCQADAVTVSPYLGAKALEPFLVQIDRGIIVLARTSNPGAGEFQDLVTLTHDPRQKPDGLSAEDWLARLCEDAKPLYQRVAENVAREWDVASNCLIVVGATYPAEAAAIRQRVGNLPFLIPGVGTQGGDVEKIVLASRTGDKLGMIINSSSGIIFASGGLGFAEAAAVATFDLNQKINQSRTAA